MLSTAAQTKQTQTTTTSTTTTKPTSSQTQIPNTAAAAMATPRNAIRDLTSSTLSNTTRPMLARKNTSLSFKKVSLKKASRSLSGSMKQMFKLSSEGLTGASGSGPSFYAGKGDLKQLQKLMDQGISPNHQDANGFSPLHLAAMNNHLPIVQYLVRSCGVDVNMRDEVDMTAMHYAAGESHAEIVRFLAENGADRTMTVMDGSTALHLAVSQNFDQVVLALTRGAGAEKDAKNKHGQTALHIAVSNNFLEIIGYLVQNCQVDVNCKDLAGYTPMHVAANGAAIPVMRALIAGGADVNVQSKNGFAPLHLAAQSSSFESVRYIVEELKANVLLPDMSGRLALELCRAASPVFYLLSDRTSKAQLALTDSTEQSHTPDTETTAAVVDSAVAPSPVFVKGDDIEKKSAKEVAHVKTKNTPQKKANKTNKTKLISTDKESKANKENSPGKNKARVKKVEAVK